MSGNRLFVEIYVLYDPRDGIVRYVGQSVNARKRCQWHISNAKRNNKKSKYRVYNWIRKILSEGIETNFRVIELTTDADSSESEWISIYLASGHDLCNHNSGGGASRGMKHSQETKNKIGAIHKGKILSKETRDKISRSKCGTRLSSEHKLKIAAATKLRGPNLTESGRKKLSDRMLGNEIWKLSNRKYSQERIIRASGENCHWAKLTSEQVLSIRSRFKESGRSLASEFNTTPATISRIRSGKIWKNLL